MDAIKNFAAGIVSIGYNAAATSIVMTTGHGARFAAAPHNLVWWNNTDYPGVWDDPNLEIVRVTAIATDTLTVTRAQESTGASTKNTSGKEYRMMQAITAALVAQLAPVDGNIGAATATTPAANDNDTSVATTAYVQTELAAYADDIVTFTNKTFGALATLTVTGTATVGSLEFEGATADAFETTVSAVDPTADRAVTIPDETVELGFRNIPQNSQSAAYTLVLRDAGKHILHPSADTTARIFTIPANSSVAYPVGTAVTIVNQNAGGVITIAITTDTMRLAGAGTTGSRTLAANGMATALKITTTEWIISGTGLT